MYYAAQLFNEEDPFNPENNDRRWIPYGIFFDLSDTNPINNVGESRITVRGRPRPIDDRVSGYTARQYYSALVSGATSPRDFINYFRNSFGGNNRAAIDDLLRSYE